jgi:hypothetical protein
MAVERSRWTDDRLDDLAERVMRQDVLEARFDGLERQFEALERRFEGLERAVTDLRGEIVAMRGELYSTRRWMITLWVTGVFALLAVLIEVSIRS